MKTLLAAFLAVSTMSPAPASDTFTGTVSDDMCAAAGHASMRMGPTDAECTNACVGIHGSSYVLVSGKNVYVLSDQKTPEKFAAARVRVVGTLDARTKTITVESIVAAR